jgi:hypothetical protein
MSFVFTLPFELKRQMLNHGGQFIERLLLLLDVRRVLLGLFFMLEQILRPFEYSLPQHLGRPQLRERRLRLGL